jgi:CXXX repeat radical SAM target protein
MTKKIPRKIGRRGFLKSGAAVLPALAVLGLALTAASPARADNCGGACSNECAGSCLNGCTGSCMNGCTGSCMEGCEGGSK